jgi:hypothetical protein
MVDATRAGKGAWVSASGPVEILRDGEGRSINARIRRRYLAPEALGGPIEAALAQSDDVTLGLAPAAWRAWTAPIVESPERWFQRSRPSFEVPPRRGEDRASRPAPALLLCQDALRAAIEDQGVGSRE